MKTIAIVFLVATAIYRAIPGAFRVSMHGEAARAVVDAGLGATAASRHLLETQPTFEAPR